jgi:hypothetical protein
LLSTSSTVVRDEDIELRVYRVVVLGARFPRMLALECRPTVLSEGEKGAEEEERVCETKNKTLPPAKEYFLLYTIIRES